MRRAALIILLSLLLVSLLFAPFSIREAKASGTIYIKADGSITPPTANITTTLNITYTFTDNNYDAIVIERDSIVLDGNGFLLQGNGSGTGIDLSGRVNVTVQNLHIDAFHHGIDLRDSSNNTVAGNNITANHLYGVYLDDSSNNTISGNNIADNWFGIWFDYSPRNTVSGNHFANPYCGVMLYHSSRNTVAGNVFVGDGLFIRSSFRNVVEDNTVNGRPLVYLEGASNQTVAEAGQVILVSSEHIRVENLNLSHTMCGAELFNTTNTLITGSNITDNDDGVVLYSSSNNTISSNNVADSFDGVALRYSSGNTISNNNIADSNYGVFLSSSSGNTVSGNNITNNYEGIMLYSSSRNTISSNNVADNDDGGVYLSYSSGNTVAGNIITNNNDGLMLYHSSGNTVSGNHIADNKYGIVLDVSSNNSIYHNNFINNTRQEIHYGSGSNTWDASYPSGGNYWSDYTGIDAKRDPSQDQPGSDGIGDAPYVHNSDNQDRYPLTKPYPWDSPDLGITHLEMSKAVVGQGYPLHVNVTMFNYGVNTEHFNVTVYANTTIIHTSENITLTSRNATILTSPWNTTGFAKGSYIIEVVISTAPNETDTSDNTLTNSWIFVTIPGDVDGDSDVDIYDVTRFVACYCLDWVPDPNTDIDGDGDVDIYDVVILCGNYGNSW